MPSSERQNQLTQIRSDRKMLPAFVATAIQMGIPQAGAARKFGTKN